SPRVVAREGDLMEAQGTFMHRVHRAALTEFVAGNGCESEQGIAPVPRLEEPPRRVHRLPVAGEIPDPGDRLGLPARDLDELIQCVPPRDPIRVLERLMPGPG